jgi:NitT/TauT family transport system substrate-binding protein/sulfonate transport system substrate-binding protein
MIPRRIFLTGAATAALPVSTAFGAADKVLRVGYQKGSAIFMVAKQNGSLERLFQPLAVRIEWAEFQYGPPMLEAMRAGSIDVGAVGDTPPIFAQVARANLLYVAAAPSGASAILVPSASKLDGLPALKGKRVAFSRGSSAHNLTVAALEKAGLTYSDITPVYLGPADASAAFQRGNIDAWAIWDPYYAIYEVQPGVRVLAKSSDITPQNSFFMARREYVEANPDIIGKAIAEFSRVGKWTAENRPDVAKLVSEATGIPQNALLRALNRNPLQVLPMDDTFAKSQQEEADRFHELGLVPRAIDVREEIWRATA